MILLPWSPRKLPHTAESQSRSRWSSICNRWNLWAGGDDQGPSRSRLNIYENQSTVNYDINHRWLQSLSYTHQMFCQRSNEGCQLPAFSAIPQLNKNCQDDCKARVLINPRDSWQGHPCTHLLTRGCSGSEGMLRIPSSSLVWGRKVLSKPPLYCPAQRLGSASGQWQLLYSNLAIDNHKINVNSFDSAPPRCIVAKGVKISTDQFSPQRN